MLNRIVIALALLFFVPGAEAHAEKVGAQFQANTGAVALNDSWATAPLRNGGFVVVWVSEGGPQQGVYGQIYDAGGKRVGGEFRADNSPLKYRQNAPSVASLRDGGFVVTWVSYTQDGNGYGIYGHRFTASGGRVGAEFRVNASTNGDQDGPSVAGLKDGGFVVAWQSNVARAGTEVFAQRYNAAGGLTGPEFKINSVKRSGSHRHPRVAELSDGGFAITWTFYGQTSAGTFRGIFGRRYYAAGASTKEFMITDRSSELPMGYVPRPSIAGLTNGGFVIGWDGMPGRIYAQRISPDGTREGDRITVNTTGPLSGDTNIAPLLDGRFTVIWRAAPPDGQRYVLGQSFRANGLRLGSEFRVAESHTYQPPGVAGLRNGKFVVTWQGRDDATGKHNIYGQRFSSVRLDRR